MLRLAYWVQWEQKQYRLVEEERVVGQVVRGEQAAEYADCDLERAHATHFGEVELLRDPLTGVPVLYKRPQTVKHRQLPAQCSHSNIFPIFY